MPDKNILCYISYEEDYPLWSDIIFTPKRKNVSYETYFKNLITSIEWCGNKKVKALKIELNNEDTSHFKINKSITYKV